MQSSFLSEHLGRTVTLKLRGLDARYAWLEPEAPEASPGMEPLALPRAQLPEDAREGDLVDAFVYLDSDDHAVATTIAPHVERDEVAFLTVADVTPIGAFVDWGLGKQLLVPFKEQTRELQVGDREPFGVQLDKSQRLCGTMRIRELLHLDGDFKLGEWVQGEAWRNEPGIGLFVIVERRFLGLMPAHEPHALKRGEATKFRVSQRQHDGKIELSLRGLAHEQLDDDAERVLSKLRQIYQQNREQPSALAAGELKVSDRSDPEQIRVLFGLSKKAFKRAVGRLLKQGDVTLDADSFIVPR